MSDMDFLDKALDTIEERVVKMEEGGMPESYDAIVTKIESTTRENIFGTGGKWGKPDDPFIQIYFTVLYDNQELDKGRTQFPITTGIRSKLARYLLKFGRPKVDQEIIVFSPKDSEYWEIDLSKDEV